MFGNGGGAAGACVGVELMDDADSADRVAPLCTPTEFILVLEAGLTFSAA